MLTILITLFAITSGFTTADESCRGHVGFVCRPREPQPPFPKTAKGLKEVCDILTEAFECGVDFEGRCNTEPGFIDKANKILDVLKEVCTEDTLLHGVIVENLECFEKILVRPNECIGHPLDEESMEMQVKELVKEGLDALDEENKEDKYSCLRGVNVLACQSVLTENECGTAAMDAYVQVMRKIFPLIIDTNEKCGEKFTEILPAVIRLRKVANEVEEALEKRKK